MNVVHVISGERGSGKTTSLINLAHRARQTGHVIAGIAAPVVYHRGERIGYDLLDLRTGNRTPWMRTSRNKADIGPFRIECEGVMLAKAALDDACIPVGGFVFIDEIGPLELDDRGHAWSIPPLLKSDVAFLAVTARPSISQELSGHWHVNTSIWSPRSCSELGDSLGLELYVSEGPDCRGDGKR